MSQQTAKIRALSQGDHGPEVLWLKKWLNFLVDPSPKLALTNKFDDDTGKAVIRLKLQLHHQPLTATADMNVFTAIWRASTIPKLASFANMSFNGPIRFDKEVLLDHFFESFSVMTDDTVPNLLWLLAKIESD